MAEPLSAWIGREETESDMARAAPLAGLAATLDHETPPWAANQVPPLGHWLYFLPRALQRDIAADGHPRRGGFLPPVSLPRRMWAGNTIAFHAPIALGDPITRRSRIAAVQEKQGRSGRLVFVTVDHEVRNGRGLCITDRQDIVYRDAVRPGEGTRQPPAVAPPHVMFSRVVTPDPVLLFRYSALTFNGHRIHYDRGFCRDVEGYPGLVVHGPLTATLLVDLFLRHHPGARVAGFAFRGVNPLFDVAPFTLAGSLREGGADLWAWTPDGRIAMTARLEAT